MSACVKLWTGPSTEMCSILSCLTTCRRPAPGSSLSTYVTLWASEFVSMAFKCCSVIRTTDPVREGSRLLLSLPQNTMLNDFRKLDIDLSYNPRILVSTSYIPYSVSNWRKFNFPKKISPSFPSWDPSLLFFSPPLLLLRLFFSLCKHFHTLPPLYSCDNYIISSSPVM